MLNECRCREPPTISGYFPLCNLNELSINENSGGTIVYLKNYLKNNIIEHGFISKNIVWFILDMCPDILFCSAYFLPDNSEFYNIENFISLNNLLTSKNEKALILGDLNAYFSSILDEFVISHSHLYYSEPIRRQSQNKNAKELKSIFMSHDIIPINYLHYNNKYFEGNLTFKRGNNWLSEIDWLFMNSNILNILHDFDVIHNNMLPSNHAPISIKLNPNLSKFKNYYLIEKRSSLLGSHATSQNNTTLSTKSILTKNLNIDLFTRNISSTSFPQNFTSLNDVIKFTNESILKAVSSSKLTQHHTYNTEISRWKRILDEKCNKKLWNAIDYDGTFNLSKKDQPKDTEFAKHFSKLLYNENTYLENVPQHINRYIPILDQPFSYQEYNLASKSLNDSAANDSLKSGTLKLLPMYWIFFILNIFNNIFFSGEFPEQWSHSRMFVIFKKGCSKLCSNYRGISVLPSLCKLYDKMITNRLSLWFTPSREQAGNQKKRECMEHILSLRLLFSYAKRKKKKLFVMFIDFSTAYDRMNRTKLLNLMLEFGCSTLMLRAIFSMYLSTSVTIGIIVIIINQGVRQGSPSSGLLFVIYMEKLIRMLKLHENDGFLSWLHCLVFMDDTIILSTSRVGLEQKFNTLLDYCNLYDMKINPTKSNFMVINGSVADKEPFIHENITISHCSSYKYLGCIFSSDANINTAIKLHLKETQFLFSKFINFLVKSTNMPFFLKNKVLNSAFLPAFLYSAESWFNYNLQPLNSVYTKSIKGLLNVRSSTINILALFEANMPTLQYYVKIIQKRTYKRLLSQNRDSNDDPFYFCYNLCLSSNIPEAIYIRDICSDNIHYSMINGVTDLKQKITNSFSSKINTYKSLNPSLVIHPVYENKYTGIEEYKRFEFSKFRLSSHKLRVEKDRWRRPIPPYELRICPCDLNEVQDESHVLQSCSFTTHIRNEYTGINFNISNFFTDTDPKTQVDIIFKIQKIFV